MTIARYVFEQHLIQCVCSCGKEFTLSEFPGYQEAWLQESAARMQRCPECLEKKKQLDYELKMEQQGEIARAATEKRIAELNTPENFRDMTSPPVRYVAEWIWEHRDRSILLKGPTGSGKTTSALFVARKYVERNIRARYTTLRELLAAWVEAKKDDRPAVATNILLHNISCFDVYIIDEVINKCVISLSGQELLFELIDAFYSGERKTRLWLLGNFQQGSLEQIFADSAPVYRRLRECFLCAEIDPDSQTVKTITF